MASVIYDGNDWITYAANDELLSMMWRSSKLPHLIANTVWKCKRKQLTYKGQLKAVTHHRFWVVIAQIIEPSHDLILSYHQSVRPRINRDEIQEKGENEPQRVNCGKWLIIHGLSNNLLVHCLWRIITWRDAKINGLLTYTALTKYGPPLHRTFRNSLFLSRFIDIRSGFCSLMCILIKWMV